MESERRKRRRWRGAKDSAGCQEKLVSMVTWRHALMTMMTSRKRILLFLVLLLLLGCKAVCFLLLQSHVGFTGGVLCWKREQSSEKSSPPTRTPSRLSHFLSSGTAHWACKENLLCYNTCTETPHLTHHRLHVLIAQYCICTCTSFCLDLSIFLYMQNYIAQLKSKYIIVCYCMHFFWLSPNLRLCI